MMIRTRLFIALATVLLLCASVLAEVDTVWTWIQDGSEGYQDQISSIIQLEDGSIVAAGWANSHMVIGHMDAWLGKFSSAGVLEWSYEYDMPDIGQYDRLEYFSEIKEAQNGGFIVIGRFEGAGQSWLVRFDEQGDTLWTLTDVSSLGTVAVTTDSGFVLGGSAFNGTDYDVLLVKYDDDGEELWRQSHGSAGVDEYCTQLIAAPDSTIYSAEYNGNAFDGTNLQLSKIDAAGEPIWTEQYEDEEIFICSATSIKLTDEGNVVMGACSVPITLIPRTEFRMVVTDPTGNSLVDETYSQGFFDNYCFSAIPLGEEGYALFGHTTYVYGDEDLQRNIYLVRTDTDGDVIWTQEFGEESYEEICYDAILSQSGGYLIGGGTFPKWSGVLAQDILLMETTIEGATPSEIVVSPDELDFGTIWVGDTLTLPIEISLTGEYPVTIESIYFDYQWGFEVDIETPYTVQPEETLIVNVSFIPTGAADWSGNMTISSDAVNDSITINIIADAIVNNLPDSKDGTLPEKFEVSHPYPNPFNSTVSVQVALPGASELKLHVFDVLGREVFTSNPGIFDAGYRTLSWHARGFAAGIYFLRVDSGENHSMKKVLLVK